MTIEVFSHQWFDFLICMRSWNYEQETKLKLKEYIKFPETSKWLKFIFSSSYKKIQCSVQMDGNIQLLISILTIE